MNLGYRNLGLNSEMRVLGSQQAVTGGETGMRSCDPIVSRSPVSSQDLPEQAESAEGAAEKKLPCARCADPA